MKQLTFLLTALICMASFVSCGSDDNEKANPETTPNNQTSAIEGEWVYYETQGNNQGAIYVEFYNGTGYIATYNYNQYSGQYTVNSEIDFNYTYDSRQGVINIVYPSSNKTDTWTVNNVNSNQITLTLFGVSATFMRMTDNDDDDDNGNSGGNSGYNTRSYAPDDASGYHITAITDFSNYSTTLDLYFNSNYSVSSASYFSTFALVSASYEKTGSNTAKITYTYSSSSGTNSTTLQLNFTSENGGTTKFSNGKEGRFTIAKESSYVVASAPESIAYKKFTIVIANVLEEWYQFGSQTGSSVKITSFDPGLGSSSSYSIVRCTYNKMGNKNAELVIETRFMSSSSTTIDTYSLTFRDSRSGTYSCYSTSPGNRFAEDKTTTGNFTLE